MSLIGLWLALASTAASAAPGYYAPQDVAAASEQFRRAQANAGSTFEALQSRSDALAAALVQYETALDLLGEEAPADQRTRQRELQHRFQREQAVVAEFANHQADVFTATFEAALGRALAGRGLVECHVEAPSLRLGPGFARATPTTCDGDDQNAAVAARMDADPQLARALDGLLQTAWPAFSIAPAPQPAVGGDSASVDLLALMQAGAPDALAAIAEADEDARADFQAAIEDGATTAQRAAMVDAAHRVTARTASRRAAVAAPTIQVVEKLRKKLPKLGIPADFGWCVQPQVLGGCTAPALTADVARALAEQPKVASALQRSNATVP